MSRIDEALEQARLSRQQGNKGLQPTPAGPEPVAKAPAMKETPCYDPEQCPPPVTEERLVSVTAPNSMTAEEYRKLKESLLKSTRKSGVFKNLLMTTSPNPSEGKTLTSLNLAISLAQEYDHTVLLIDADLRKPSCAKYLGLPNEPGLSECLREGTDISDVLIKTGIGRLQLLPAGTRMDNPAELFSSQRMRDLMMEIKNRYKDRYVLVDTPPVLPFSETRSMADIVDHVILVVREGHSSMENIRESLEALGSGDLLGMIFNAATAVPLGKKYGYGYGYYAHGNQGEQPRK